ncbi:hypothetical protein [Paenibacillus sp. NPDC058071]|uniref:hypothetical protein n=1 Tax=Paenibacillus sp. NPDC058071 TaxID=3346326 RepID=UPI0036D96608
MSPIKWLSIIAHLLLGAVFPYVLVGSILLLFGFMSPPTITERLTGAAIAGVYLLILIAVNVGVQHRLPSGKDRGLWLLINAVALIVAAIFSFSMIRVLG